jgi:hypothetical protein
MNYTHIHFVVVISNVTFSFPSPYLGNQKKTIHSNINTTCMFSIHLTPNLEEIFFTLGHL